MWDGDTCPCDTFGLDPDDLPRDGIFTVVTPDDEATSGREERMEEEES